jgi:hypothetical protein
MVPNPVTRGRTVTFTTVVSGLGGTPTGTVVFYDGATLLGSGTLNAGGQATFQTSALTVGTHTITAEYGGDGTFDPSVSDGLDLVVASTPGTTDIRTAIIAALEGLPGLGSIDIRGAASGEDCYTIFPRGKGIGVVYGGMSEAGPQMIGARSKTHCTQTWYIAVLASSYQSPTGSHSDAESLVDSVRAIRGVPITLTDGQIIYLRLNSESLAEPPDRPAQGGPVLYSCEYKTSELYV